MLTICTRQAIQGISVPSMLRPADPFDGIGNVAGLSPDVSFERRDDVTQVSRGVTGRHA